jgi:hypothetical protein
MTIQATIRITKPVTKIYAKSVENPYAKVAGKPTVKRRKRKPRANHAKKSAKASDAKTTVVKAKKTENVCL